MDHSLSRLLSLELPAGLSEGNPFEYTRNQKNQCRPPHSKLFALSWEKEPANGQSGKAEGRPFTLLSPSGAPPGRRCS